VKTRTPYGHRQALPFVLSALLAVAGCATTKPEPAPEPAPEPPPTSEAEPVEQDKVEKDVVKPAHPVRYVVKKGDTLWDIAALFLRDPWVWPEIWSVNPQIENPHLIYPGDVITLTYVGGEPRLAVSRPGIDTDDGGLTVERIEPGIREMPLDQAIPTIPSDAIRQFLNRPNVLPQEELDAAPYIVGNYEGRLISAQGDDVFARGFPEGGPQSRQYNVLRPGDPLTDPQTGEILGYEAIYAGQGRVTATGDPVKISLTNSVREILRGDRLFPTSQDPSRTSYLPKAPDNRVRGQIISLFDAISQVASKQVVVINLGARSGMEPGHVLGIRQSGGSVTDPYAGGETEEVQLPSQEVGTLMVFKVFDRVSYALIMESTRAIHLNDFVTNP
jgi:hypothetical protein